MSLSTLDQVRLQIGDTDTDNALFTNAEIDQFLERHDDQVLPAAADACDALAARFARDFDFKWKDGEFKKGSRADRYAKLAEQLRARAGVGQPATSLPVTRVDGYSDDLSTEDGAGVGRADRTGTVRAGYFDGDIPR